LRISYKHIVSHQSSREGGRIHAAILHTTEGGDNPKGMADLKSLGALFDTEEASAHLGVNVEGKIARYVEDDQKAWAVCNFNSLTISLEQIGFSAFTKEEWFKRDKQLRGAAEFLQYCHEKYEVPLRHGWVVGGTILRTGVLQHKNLGVEGCGHTDCGDGYPEKYVRLLARYFVAHKHKAKNAPRLKRKLNRIRKHFHLPALP